MGEKVKASVHSQRGGYSLAHNDGSLYHEDDEKFKRGRRGNVHVNPDGTELTGGRQVGATVKAAREWYKEHLGPEYERAVHSDGWKRNPSRRKSFDEFCDMKRNQFTETIFQVGDIDTSFDTTPALRAGLKAVGEYQAGLNARAAAKGSKARIETIGIDLHIADEGSPHGHKVDAAIADDGTMNMDAALKDMGIEKAHPPRRMIKPKGKRKTRPETDKEYERRCTRVSTYTAEVRRVFEDAVDQWFAENGYDVRLDRERSDREHMELDEFRATHQRAYEQGVAAAEAEAKVVRNAAEAAAESAKREAVQARRVRDLYAGESYQTKDGHTALGTKGLKAENARLRAENERLERDNAAKRAEVSRLLDGCDRDATEEDYLDAKYGDRTIAEFYAHKNYWADYHANGGKPKTVHEPGLRETVKAAEEARQGYERATEEACRERDALREFREGLVKLLEDLCKSVKMAQKEEDRKGRKATAKFFGFVHRIFVEPLKALDDAHVPEPPTLDRAAWDDALSAAKAEQARAEGRAHATATARVPASSVPREVRTDWEPRKQSNDRGIER